MSIAAYGVLLDEVRGLRWPARATVRAGATGLHASRVRGHSAEFTEYRPYRQGDDPRRLDWKLLARSDRAYIRLATEQALLGTLVIVDASASMDFPRAGGGAVSKWTHACRIGVALAAIAHAQGDPVGLLVPAAHGRTPARVEVRARRGIVSEVARAIDAIVPGDAIDLAPALARAALPPRVAILTDLLGDAEALLALARVHRVAGGELHMVHVIAEEELAPTSLPLIAVDPERPDVRRPLSAATREGYETAFAAWRDGVARQWREAGASYSVTRTAESAARVARRIVGGAETVARTGAR